MSRLSELLQFRAPAGTARALEQLAQAEGRKASDVARAALLDRLKVAGVFVEEAA